MRKISKEASIAFLNGQNYKKTNTQVIGGDLLLHGNKIAEFQSLFTNDGNKNFNITLAGWNTNTTRDRLNALPNVHITTKLGQAYLNGQKWGGEWITIINN